MATVGGVVTTVAAGFTAAAGRTAGGPGTIAVVVVVGAATTGGEVLIIIGAGYNIGAIFATGGGIVGGESVCKVGCDGGGGATILGERFGPAGAGAGGGGDAGLEIVEVADFTDFGFGDGPCVFVGLAVTDDFPLHTFLSAS